MFMIWLSTIAAWLFAITIGWFVFKSLELLTSFPWYAGPTLLILVITAVLIAVHTTNKLKAERRMHS